jgi:hypothetical protein
MTFGKLGSLGKGFGRLGGGSSLGRGIRFSPSPVAENAANGTVIGTATLAGLYTGTPAWSLSDDAGGKFAINSSTGVVTKAAALDAETAQSHSITIAVASVTPAFASRVASISVTDVNEATPVITSNGGGATASVTVDEGSNVAITTVTATDADVTAALVYSISGGAQAANFAINSSTGVLTMPTAAVGSHEVIVRVSDGTNTDTQTITVTVNDVATAVPVNSVAPVVSGTETEDETLSCTTGTWSESPTSYTYQWYQAVLENPPSDNDVVVDGNGDPLTDDPIVGATSSTYALQAGDVAERIFCIVTATNGIGSASEFSNVTGVIAAAGGWVPADEGANLRWFLTAKAGVTESGGAVSSWADQAAIQPAIVQASGANKPTYNATGMNGQPCISFVGANATRLAVATFNFSSSTASLFIILKSSGGFGSNPRIVSLAANGVGNDFTTPSIVLAEDGTSNTAYFYSNGYLGDSSAANMAVNTVLGLTLDGTNSRRYVNGVLSAGSPVAFSSSIGGGAGGTMTIGYGLGDSFTGDIAAILLFGQRRRPCGCAGMGSR